MTLRDLIDLVEQADPEPLLTLRQVSEVTGESYKTIRRWVYIERVLPTVPYGPHRRKRVRGTVVLEMFCPHRTKEIAASPGPVRQVPSRFVRCGPFTSAGSV